MTAIHYAKSGELNIAYRVVGDGPGNLVYVSGWVTNVEVMQEDPGMARFLRRLASFSRLICFDKRGIGLSDPVPPVSCPISRRGSRTFGLSWTLPVPSVPTCSGTPREGARRWRSRPPTPSGSSA